MDKQKLHIALEGTCSGDVTGGLAMTEANLHASNHERSEIRRVDRAEMD